MVTRPLRFRGFGGPARSGRPARHESTPFAAWPLRAVAYVIDTFVVFLIAAALIAIAGQPEVWQHFGRYSSATGGFALRAVLILLAVLVYFPLIMWKTNGQTVGKMAMAIRVVRTDGKPMTLARATWREAVIKGALLYALGLIPVVGDLVFLADYLIPIPDKQNRAGHDILSGTRVIRLTSE